MVDAPIPEPLHAALGAVGLSWDWLSRRSSGIILFGSRAAGVASPSSDWDLMCIGPSGPKPAGAVDLVWVDPRVLDSPRWLGSELASHVAAYGTVLFGSHAWRSSVCPSSNAATTKARRIRAKLEGLEVAWPVLGETKRRRHARWLRLELQRFECLAQARPVPPTALLEREWESFEERDSWTGRIANALEIDPRRLDDATLGQSISRGLAG